MHEMSNPASWENISKCRLLKILPRVLNLKNWQPKLDKLLFMTKN